MPKRMSAHEAYTEYRKLDVYDADEADREFEEIVREAVEVTHDRLTGEYFVEEVIAEALRRWRGEK